VRMRIVAGEFRGRRIVAPPGRTTRPTRDKVREAWFNVLGDRVCGGRVVDLFAGSGALGLEALSRGATHVDFIERSRRAVAALERNVAALGVAGRVQVYREEVLAFLARIGSDAPYDIALADPPYESDAAVRLIESYRREPFATLLCLECRSDTVHGPQPDLVWERRYGDATLAFFTRPNGGGYPIEQ
jgi:16S rRNA (guanine966-N2)-methyltransferase